MVILKKNHRVTLKFCICSDYKKALKYLPNTKYVTTFHNNVTNTNNMNTDHFM